MPLCIFFFFFFNDTATTEIYTLSLHDALPIWGLGLPVVDLPDRQQRGLSETARPGQPASRAFPGRGAAGVSRRDRKSTRLNSSHLVISYAVFCLKKKKQTKTEKRSTPE